MAISLSGFKNVALTGLSLVGLTMLGACSPGFEGEYSDPAKAEIVDDKWNETDARKTAESMVKGMLNKPWLDSFKKKNDKRPVVIVADIQNATDEHLNTKALTDAIQDELINSGKVRFVAKAMRQQLLDELDYQQQGGVSRSTKKRQGRQTGADYMLTGEVSSSVHAMDGLKTVTYQTVLTLTNIETFEKEWSNRYNIKKRFKRSGAGW